MYSLRFEGYIQARQGRAGQGGACHQVEVGVLLCLLDVLSLLSHACDMPSTFEAGGTCERIRPPAFI